ncbi:hypothetical protein, partial [Tahibacter sp.]|uniref:hypothetical protein n=1 Tax=Tahibacter sp. TaxID=2056211 RepID=UPI0028C4A2C0
PQVLITLNAQRAGTQSDRPEPQVLITLNAQRAGTKSDRSEPQVLITLNAQRVGQPNDGVERISRGGEDRVQDTRTVAL